MSVSELRTSSCESRRPPHWPSVFDGSGREVVVDSRALAEDESEVLLAEVAQALEQVRGADARRAYADLLAAVSQGEVPDELQSNLETLLDVGLESGRIRKVHTAHGEAAAERVYVRTPSGCSGKRRRPRTRPCVVLRAIAGGGSCDAPRSGELHPDPGDRPG